MATPIGTLGDLSPRVRKVLASVDLILSEDTRRARRLLAHLDLAAGNRLRSLHEHNEEKKVPSLLDMLTAGKSLALISDAGTPVLSDPGFLLVRAARENGIRVCSLPGASAFVAALAASGQPPLPATLCGFLPARSGQRQRRIAELDILPWTLVILLSPHRLAGELADIAKVLGGGRRATLLAELSKLHERAVTGTLSELAAGGEAAAPRGEYVLVVAPAETGQGPAAGVDPEMIRTSYHALVNEGWSRRDALREAAQRLGVRRRQVFDAVASEVRREDETDG